MMSCTTFFDKTYFRFSKHLSQGKILLFLISFLKTHGRSQEITKLNFVFEKIRAEGKIYFFYFGGLAGHFQKRTNRIRPQKGLNLALEAPF